MIKSPLRDKVIILTGASSGIGWATALELGRRRPRIAILARRIQKLVELSKLLEAAQAQVLTLPADVSDPSQCRRAVSEVAAKWGRVDILINNAGISGHKRFEEEPFEDIEAVVKTNYVGAAAMIHASIPHMLRQGRGHIVNVASIAGLLGFPYLASYSASKFALVGLTEALRREYWDRGVTLTALCPGTVDTPMAELALKDAQVAKYARPKTAQEVAQRIVAACLHRPAEEIFGDAPAPVVRLAKLFPWVTDRAMHAIMKRVHPLGRNRPRGREVV